jgi:hypothetical protein
MKRQQLFQCRYFFMRGEKEVPGQCTDRRRSKRPGTSCERIQPGSCKASPSSIIITNSEELTMNRKMKFKRIIAGLACVGALALSANAQALVITLDANGVGDAGVFGSTLGQPGTATNPITFTFSPADGLFLNTVTFDLGTNQLFNMTSTVNGISFFGAPIFSNVNDSQVVPPSATHLNVPLPNLGLAEDYHIHPQGLNAGGGSYSIAMWGTPAAVPVPAAIYLFGSGVIGLVGLARRKMKAMA